MGEPGARSTRRTIAEPTITPSATRPTSRPRARAWLMPKPTQTGIAVIGRSTRSGAAPGPAAARWRAPVTPVSDTT